MASTVHTDNYTAKHCDTEVPEKIFFFPKLIISHIINLNNSYK